MSDINNKKFLNLVNFTDNFFITFSQKLTCVY